MAKRFPDEFLRPLRAALGDDAGLGIQGQDEFPYVAGEFVWTGFDYLGEPTPYNGDMSNLLNFTDPAEKARMQKELEALGRNQSAVAQFLFRHH